MTERQPTDYELAQLRSTCKVCDEAPGMWCMTSRGSRTPFLHVKREAIYQEETTVTDPSYPPTTAAGDEAEAPANDPLGIAASVGVEDGETADLQDKVLAKLKDGTTTVLPPGLLTERELKLLDNISDLAGQFSDICGLDRTRDADMQEAVFHIHALQNMVMAQACARAYPQFRLMGQRNRQALLRHRTFDPEEK